MLHVFVLDVGVQPLAKERGIGVEFVVQGGLDGLDQLIFRERVEHLVLELVCWNVGRRAVECLHATVIRHVDAATVVRIGRVKGRGFAHICKAVVMIASTPQVFCISAIFVIVCNLIKALKLLMHVVSVHAWHPYVPI